MPAAGLPHSMMKGCFWGVRLQGPLYGDELGKLIDNCNAIPESGTPPQASLKDTAD